MKMHPFPPLIIFISLISPAPPPSRTFLANQLLLPLHLVRSATVF